MSGGFLRSMEMHQIRYVLAVDRQRNFTRAAEHSNITQPALTRAVRKLEAEVGGRLFSRRPGHIELTELGRVLLPHFNKIDDQVMAALADARNIVAKRKQRLRIALMRTIIAPQVQSVIEELARSYPNLEIDLTEHKPDCLLAALINEDVDVALMALPAYPEHINALPIYAEAYVLAVPQEHRFAKLESVSLSQLNGESFIERVDCEYDDHLEAALRVRPSELVVRYQSEREDVVQAMISAGLGLTILPATFPVAHGVVRRALVDPEMSRTVSLVTGRNRVPSIAVREFQRIVIEHSRDRSPRR